MGAKERDIINKRLASLSENERLFRANSGMGWAGVSTRKGDFIVIKNPRPFHGMPEGFPDLVGWTSVEITPDMVGQRVAVFTGVEVKSGKQKIKPGSTQDDFREIIIRMGGIHEVLSS